LGVISEHSGGVNSKFHSTPPPAAKAPSSKIVGVLLVTVSFLTTFRAAVLSAAAVSSWVACSVESPLPLLAIELSDSLKPRCRGFESSRSDHFKK